MSCSNLCVFFTYTRCINYSQRKSEYFSYSLLSHINFLLKNVRKSIFHTSNCQNTIKFSFKKIKSDNFPRGYFIRRCICWSGIIIFCTILLFITDPTTRRKNPKEKEEDLFITERI